MDYLPLFTQLQAAPSVGHLLEQSLHLGIPKRRDPSFSEFRFGGIPPFGNSYLEGSLISEILKTPPFCRLLAVFCHVFCLFTDNLYVHCHFCKKKLVHLTFSGRESADCKVPPHIGGHHFLLCQHTKKKDIAG